MSGLAVAICLHAIGLLTSDSHLDADLGASVAIKGRFGEALGRVLRAVAGAMETSSDLADVSAGGNLRDLADCLALQVPRPALGIARALAIHRVRHVGRARVLKLANAAGGEPSQVLRLTEEQLRAAVGPAQVSGVRTALMRHLKALSTAETRGQLARASTGLEVRALAERLFAARGTAFEPEVAGALTRLGWTTEAVVQSGRTPMPDMIALAEPSNITVECKTAADFEGEVSRSEVVGAQKQFATVLEGAAVVVGRPRFSDAAVEWAHSQHNRAPAVRLVTAGALMECLLLVASGDWSQQEARSALLSATHTDVARIRQLVDLGRSVAP